MSARVQETVTKSFRVDVESMRDLDAIVRDRCQDLNPQPSFKYEVQRKDNLQYTTNDVEDLLKERNGDLTGIQKVVLLAEASSILEFKVEFSDAIRIIASSDDRARLIVLTSDVRTLIRERMVTRRSMRSGVSRGLTAFAFSLLVGLGYLGVVATVAEGKADKYSDQIAAYNENSEKAQSSRVEQRKIWVSKAEELLARGSESEKLSYLVDTEKDRLRFQIDLGAVEFPSKPKREWWQPSLSSIFLVFIGAFIVAYGGLALFFRRPEQIYLIGDQIVRQARRDKLRDRIVWSVLVALVLGVASSIISAFIIE